MALRPGHVIAITGAASGIGLSTAHMLASRHAYLALADINSSHLSTLERTIRASYPSCHMFTYTLDVRCEDNVAYWLELVHTIFGRLDGAVNLAGIIPPSIGISGIDEQDVHEWRNVLDVNLTGTMLCMKYQIRLMKQNRMGNVGDGVRGGSIVNASSIAGLRGMPRNAAYTASKHAVIGLTRTAAIENGKSGIRVNAICPGYIDTPMNVRSREIAEESGRTDERERKIKSVALGRGGKADEVAELICYLLGEGSGYVTGTAISVDGGWNC